MRARLQTGGGILSYRAVVSISSASSIAYSTSESRVMSGYPLVEPMTSTSRSFVHAQGGSAIRCLACVLTISAGSSISQSFAPITSVR